MSPAEAWSPQEAERALLEAIADRKLRRRDIAVIYNRALHADYGIDWAKVNLAIRRRWSLAALNYIKHLAWDSIKPRRMQ